MKELKVNESCILKPILVKNKWLTEEWSREILYKIENNRLKTFKCIHKTTFSKFLGYRKTKNYLYGKRLPNVKYGDEAEERE